MGAMGHTGTSAQLLQGTGVKVSNGEHEGILKVHVLLQVRVRLLSCYIHRFVSF
jgi:hypothetical protein